MSDVPPEPSEPGFDIDALLAPAVGALDPPTSLSPLPYDLNAGVPDRPSLPWRELAEATRRALEANAGDALTYGGAAGYEPLRAWIAARQSAETGLEVTSTQVTLASGSAAAIDTIAATFVGAGDLVITGAPTYPGAIRAFKARGATILDVPQDDDGLRMDALEEALREQHAAGRRVKLIYVVATYDNPSGATLPLDRRERLAALSREYGTLIVEDDAYAGIDLDGPPPTSLFEVARGQGILRVGTFSKTIASGLRVGWVVAEPRIVQRLNFMRFDNGASPFVHHTVLAYLQGGTFDSHVARLRDLYRERRDASAAALVEHCEPYVTFRSPAGGFFHWLWLRPGLDARAVFEACQRHGVAVTPGQSYYPNGGGNDRVRLVYSALTPDELREAVARVGRALEEVATTGRGK
ncbi:MAG: PLP-dependent aminotransferase family protein [Dehalococcoidia bacterium]|nr:PLP-dependent aminotransferase family protein [Dehalococcoidia bacterium]